MGDDQRGAPREGRLEGPLHGELGLRIEVGGRLVQHHDVWRLEQQPGDGEALLLAARQAVAAVAHDGVESVGQRLDERQDLGPAQGFDEFVVAGLGLGVEQVGADRVVKEMHVLGDHADRLAQRLETRLAHVDAVDAHGAGAHVVESWHELAHRGLAGARRTHQGHELAGLGAEAHVAQYLLAGRVVQHGYRLERGQRDLAAGGIREAHMVELDARRAARHGRGIGLLGDHRLEVEDLEDAVERDQRGHDVDVDVGERRERAVETVQVGGQGDHGADVERALDRHHAAPAVDQRRRQRRGEQQGNKEEARVDRLHDVDVAHSRGLLAEVGALGAGVAKELDEQGAGDVEALDHAVVHLGGEFIAFARDRLQPATEPAGRQQERRQHGERHQRELPRQEEHDDQHDTDADQVAYHT